MNRYIAGKALQIAAPELGKLQVFKQAILLKDPLALRLLKQGESPPLRLVWGRDKEEKKGLLPKGKG